MKVYKKFYEDLRLVNLLLMTASVLLHIYTKATEQKDIFIIFEKGAKFLFWFFENHGLRAFLVLFFLNGFLCIKTGYLNLGYGQKILKDERKKTFWGLLAVQMIGAIIVFFALPYIF